MNDLRIAAAQFEHKDADKAYNLGVIDSLTRQASNAGARVISFHECSVTGYTFARKLTREQLIDLAEYIPEGESVSALTEIAKRNEITVLAGLFEKTKENELYKAYVCVDKKGLRAKFRKLHPFINKHLKAGSQYVVFDIEGWKCGILICYDNNVIENVRATTLLGAKIIFMPHVTMCTPSPRPGAGFVDRQLWENRDKDPTSLRAEFDGLKGRAWLMKWLPARAYDNGIYAVFTNAIGMDDDQLKNGCSMIIDPFGDIIAECRSFGNEIAIGTCVSENLERAGGYRYIKARRPELYGDILGMAHESEQKVSWLAK